MDLFDSLLAFDDQLAAWLEKLDAAPLTPAQQQVRQAGAGAQRGQVQNAIETLEAAQLHATAAALLADAKIVQGFTDDLTKLKGTIDEAEKVLGAIGQAVSIVAKIVGTAAAVL